LCGFPDLFEIKTKTTAKIELFKPMRTTAFLFIFSREGWHLKKNSGIKLLIGQEVLRKHPGIQLDFVKCIFYPFAFIDLMIFGA
jgi:hypothetical protein